MTDNGKHRDAIVVLLGPSAQTHDLRARRLRTEHGHAARHRCADATRLYQGASLSKRPASFAPLTAVTIKGKRKGRLPEEVGPGVQLRPGGRSWVAARESWGGTGPPSLDAPAPAVRPRRGGLVGIFPGGRSVRSLAGSN
jgi:hypothetical protein